jgi:hexokinase
MEDHLDNYTKLFTLSAQRMRMIVAAFEETLDKGLQEWDQVIVSSPLDKPSTG